MLVVPHRPSEQLLDAIEHRTLPLMQRSAASSSRGSSGSSSSNSRSCTTTAPTTSADPTTNQTVSSTSGTPTQVTDPPTVPASAASSGSELQATDQNEGASSLEHRTSDHSAGEIAGTVSDGGAAVAVLEEVAQQPEGGATAGEMVLVLLGLCRTGRLPSQEWLRAWFTMLRAESIATLSDDQVLAVLDLLAGTNFGMTPKQRWCAALLQRLQPLLPNLDSKPLQSLLALLAQWEEKGMALAPGADSRASATLGVSPAASSTTPQPSYAQLRDQVVRQIPSHVAAKLAAYDAPTVVEMMYDMWVLRAPMSKHLVQRMKQQVQLGLELGLPTSIMVKLCTALSEHAAFVCTTGDGALPAFAMGDAFGQEDEEEEEEEGLRNLQGGGSPLRGLSLQDSWLLHDEVLSRLDLDR
ncbi:hypothetical protein DUNSADRAFT_17417 [Dunaliella salina]|uniref:Uncharacterized protein n=1 Tax=Dunaliella salina TaxID=3046 RepID=A0ABQ7H011_DUNSA|nr:hypothetical protein DUNSADRAFT_17417 [Dunaliella salina]|eukprot:KAF5840200.1 hypothetical protein DUNSADRAFT_17417 [Dunaliella salina]